jgi:hypothetical protein
MSLPHFLIARDHDDKQYIVSTNLPRFVARLDKEKPFTDMHYQLENGLYVHDFNWFDNAPDNAGHLHLFTKIDKFLSRK